MSAELILRLRPSLYKYRAAKGVGRERQAVSKLATALYATHVVTRAIPFRAIALQRPFLARAPQANFHLHNILALNDPSRPTSSPTSIRNNRQNAVRSLRHQAVHRDLPPQGCQVYVCRRRRGAIAVPRTYPSHAPLRGVVALLRLTKKNRIGEMWEGDTVADSFRSRAHKEEQEGRQHQVQGPMRALHLHPCSQGHRQGREA